MPLFVSFLYGARWRVYCYYYYYDEMLFHIVHDRFLRKTFSRNIGDFQKPLITFFLGVWRERETDRQTDRQRQRERQRERQPVCKSQPRLFTFVYFVTEADKSETCEVLADDARQTVRSHEVTSHLLSRIKSGTLAGTVACDGSSSDPLDCPRLCFPPIAAVTFIVVHQPM